MKKVKIAGTDYILGWLPTISFVKPFGVDSDLFKRTLSETELNNAFFTKEDYKKALVIFSPSISYFVLGICLPMLCLNIQSGYSMDQHLAYIVEFFKTIGGDDLQIKNFGLLTKEIVFKHSSVLFASLLFSSIMFFWSFFQNYSEYLRLKRLKSRVLSKVFSIVYFGLSLLWLIVMPITLSHYFSFSELSIYIFSLLIGLYSSGIVLYQILISCLKLYYQENK